MTEETNKRKANLLDGFMAHTTEENLEENFRMLKDKYAELPEDEQNNEND